MFGEGKERRREDVREMERKEREREREREKERKREREKEKRKKVQRRYKEPRWVENRKAIYAKVRGILLG